MALLQRDGVRVSRSPWGPDDQIGRLNWITADAAYHHVQLLVPGRFFRVVLDHLVPGVLGRVGVDAEGVDPERTPDRATIRQAVTSLQKAIDVTTRRGTRRCTWAPK